MKKNNIKAFKKLNLKWVKNTMKDLVRKINI